jgi:polysaccharide export outer membrane protein
MAYLSVRPPHLLLIAILWMLPVLGGTQETTSAGQGLAPGDQISVRMFDFPDMNGPLLVHVSADGSVHLPYAGTLQAQGKTPDQLQTAISEALRNRGMVKDPNVTVDVQSAVNMTVDVIGQVLRPSSIPLYAPAPISYVISQAGGLSGLASPHVTIIHPDGVEPTSLEFDGQTPTPAALHTMVRPGDIVHVSSSGIYYIAGEVIRPGIYPVGGAMNVGAVSGGYGTGLTRNLTLLGALTQAGGITPIAARSQMRILRMEDGKRVEIKVDQVKLYKGEIADPLIHPNDIIYVPSSYIRQQTNNLFGTAVSSLYAAVQIHQAGQ